MTLEDDVIIKKGNYCDVDSYSLFYNNGGFRQTELHDILSENEIETVFLTGLARDFCVYWTALDAIKLGYVVGRSNTNGECSGKIDLFRVKNRVVHIPSWWKCCQEYQTEGLLCERWSNF